MAESLEQVSIEDGSSFLEDELEALRSIYINETYVDKNDEDTIVSIDLHPATADNLKEQYVKLTLKLTLKSGYPDVLPEINIRNPRGLSDEKLSCITKDLQRLAEDKRGNSMLFEIIEAAKDYLTAGNRPCEECAICLYGFHEDDIFTKTECYHYFHSSCLARYARNSPVREDDSDSDDSSQNALLCPVCRLPINFGGVDDSYPSPVEGDDEDDFSMTETILETQKRLQELYIKQVEKGGIIDLEAEKNKYLIEISDVPSATDAASDVRSEEDASSKIAEEKDNLQSTSPSDDVQDKLDAPKRSSDRSYNSERPERRYSRNNEERKGNDEPRPYRGSNYRNERYQRGRGGDGYRRDSRGGRNNYNRRYDSYNNDRRDNYSGGMNRGRYNNPRRNNWHENHQQSNQYDKHDDRNRRRFEDRNKQDPESLEKDHDKNSQKYENSQEHERLDRDNEDSGQRCSRDPVEKQDSEEGVSCRDDVDENGSNAADKKSDDEVQEGYIDQAKDGRSKRYGGDKRRTGYRGGYKNNQYDDRRGYDRRNVRYDNNRRYDSYDNNRTGQYDRRNDRFDRQKFNENNGSRRNEGFTAGRGNRTNETNRSRYPNRENRDKEFETKENEEIQNISTNEKESENSSIPNKVVTEKSSVESKSGEPDLSCKTSPKDEGVENSPENVPETKSSSYSSDRKSNFSSKSSDLRRQNDGRNYNRRYQRSDSNGDQYNGKSGYARHSNNFSERRHSKPQNFRRNPNSSDRGEETYPQNSEGAIAEGAGESNVRDLEDNQMQDNGEAGDFSDNQQSRKSSAKTRPGNQYQNHQDRKQGYSNRYPNNSKNTHETRPYRNNPRSRFNKSDYSDRTSNSGRRYVPQKFSNDGSHDIPQTENDSDIKHETIPTESSESVPDKTTSKKSTQVPPKSSELEKSVPTSNFLPPMSSVAPPPGFQNPTKKVVYGLAAANPPPGFNRS